MNWTPWRKRHPERAYDVLAAARLALAREEWTRDTVNGETTKTFEDWALVETLWAQSLQPRRD